MAVASGTLALWLIPPPRTRPRQRAGRSSSTSVSSTRACSDRTTRNALRACKPAHASPELVQPDEHGPSALDPADHEPVALVRLVVVGPEAHVGAWPAVDGRQQAHLLEPFLHAARGEQRRPREALGDQARGVVAERGDGVVAPLAVAGGEAVEHRLEARVLLAHLIDAVPALERRHPLGLRVAELEGAGHDARRVPGEALEHRAHEDRRVAVAEIREAAGPLVADLPQHGLEVVGYLRRVGLDQDVQTRARRVVAEVGRVLDAARAELVDD